tara:strand:+ start:1325 stop:1705 length:381 start_codon:yes stop_codon:yes gene_type:complete
MKIAVVGSRFYPHEHLVRGFVRQIAAKDPTAIIVSGGARGVDRWAADEARLCGLEVEEHLADWDGPDGRRAGFVRNSTIVARSEIIVAFWDGKSRGTRDTCRKAERQGKRLFVIDIAGKVPIRPGG